MPSMTMAGQVINTNIHTQPGLPPKLLFANYSNADDMSSLTHTALK